MSQNTTGFTWTVNFEVSSKAGWFIVFVRCCIEATVYMFCLCHAVWKFIRGFEILVLSNKEQLNWLFDQYKQKCASCVVFNLLDLCSR